MPLEILPKEHHLIEPLIFTWPETEGSVSVLRFWSAMFTRDSFELIGLIDMCEFGYE